MENCSRKGVWKQPHYKDWNNGTKVKPTIPMIPKIPTKIQIIFIIFLLLFISMVLLYNNCLTFTTQINNKIKHPKLILILKINPKFKITNSK